MAGADPTLVSERALDRGRPQLGTLGSGNHFLEVGYVEEIYDPEVARVFGLAERPGDGFHPFRFPGLGIPGLR